jgi:uncharacterized protein YoxC
MVALSKNLTTFGDMSLTAAVRIKETVQRCDTLLKAVNGVRELISIEDLNPHGKHAVELVLNEYDKRNAPNA